MRKRSYHHASKLFPVPYCYYVQMLYGQGLPQGAECESGEALRPPTASAPTVVPFYLM